MNRARLSRTTSRKSRAAATAAACIALVLGGCLGADRPVATGYPEPPAAAGGAGSSEALLGPYRAAATTKVIFNKQNFYSNYAPNSACRAGDARNFFDPATDRQVPVRPDWVKNIAVELTNSEVQISDGGVCRVYAGNASSSCATFDDLQPLSYTTSRTMLIGGLRETCTGSSCAKSAVADLWHLDVPVLTTNAAWDKQGAATVPVTGAATAGGRLWAAADFDELHNELFIYGGVAPATTANGNYAITGEILRGTFSANGSLATLSAVTASTVPSYAGWLKSSWNDAAFLPENRFGATLTYSARRDPTMKSHCIAGTDLGNGDLCTASTSADSSAIASNEHQDYLLLIGGVSSLGTFLPDIHVLKPHGHSNDMDAEAAGTIVPSDTTPQWQRMSYGATALETNALADEVPVLSVATISAPDFETPGYSITTSNSYDPGVFSLLTWTGGRAYHRTAYDPTMNRFYIFGGLRQAAAPNAGTVETELADGYVWVYDPPALGRTPSTACYQETSPSGLALGSTAFFDAATGPFFNLGVNRSYLAQETVFPTGGCLQRLGLPHSATAPAARFEHAMAFDRDQKAMLVFGGCTNAPDLTVVASNDLGNPLSRCTSDHLLNDTWIYVPPIVGEFNTTPSLAHQPMYQAGNQPGEAAVSSLSESQVLGRWIRLSPSTKPTARASAGIVYDRTRHKFYLQGGKGCTQVNTSGTCTDAAAPLNDLWEFTPPNVATDCSVSTGICSSQGTWKKLKANDPGANLPDTTVSQPTQSYNSMMVYAESSNSYGDDYYAINDSLCAGQGPNASGDDSFSKQRVGGVYIDLDRDALGSSNVLINVKYLPYDENTRLAGSINYGGISKDTGTTEDQAVVRVQLLKNPYRFIDQILRVLQPRFQEYSYDNFQVVQQLMYFSAGNGQLTERQILIPLSALDSSVNLIKIERITGSMKFFEMTLTKF